MKAALFLLLLTLAATQAPPNTQPTQPTTSTNQLQCVPCTGAGLANQNCLILGGTTTELVVPAQNCAGYPRDYTFTCDGTCGAGCRMTETDVNGAVLLNECTTTQASIAQLRILDSVYASDQNAQGLANTQNDWCRCTSTFTVTAPPLIVTPPVAPASSNVLTNNVNSGTPTLLCIDCLSAPFANQGKKCLKIEGSPVQSEVVHAGNNCNGFPTKYTFTCDGQCANGCLMTETGPNPTFSQCTYTRESLARLRLLDAAWATTPTATNANQVNNDWCGCTAGVFTPTVIQAQQNPNYNQLASVVACAPCRLAANAGRSCLFNSGSSVETIFQGTCANFPSYSFQCTNNCPNGCLMTENTNQPGRFSQCTATRDALFRLQTLDRYYATTAAAINANRQQNDWCQCNLPAYVPTYH